MPFTIRAAALTDLEALQDVYLRSSLSNEGDRGHLLAHPEDTILAEDGVREERTRVAVDPDGTVVGFASFLITKGTAELEDLFVHPSCMRRGIGTALVRDIAQHVHEKGFATLEVTANPHAMAFYEHAGFTAGHMVETAYYPAPRMQRSSRYAPDDAP
ncbi:MAG TPA: GNAT family N-acetyltransferase [Acidimicrobiales bacterium]|nr:GNAT family N-acetyltransferase [Acidimicrobiales bacterium]